MNATGTGLVRYLRTLAAQADDTSTDQQLLEQFVTRREHASFAALVRRVWPDGAGGVPPRPGTRSGRQRTLFKRRSWCWRKAGSIRKRDSLSSWLHGVAYHVADKLRVKEARRAVHERKVPSRLGGDPIEDVAWREIRCLLDSELARLPEWYRGPLVLCYLHGKTQDEAARQLAWPLRTFRRRLERARQMLARRLMRRGLTLSAALSAPLLVESTASAVVPPLLVASTIRAGLGQSSSVVVPAHITALSEGGGQALLGNKIKWVLALCVAVSMAAGGVMTHQTMATGSVAKLSAAPPAAHSAAPQPETAVEEKGDTVTIRGRVFDPDGKPFSGAKIYLIGSGDRPKKHRVRAVSGEDGRFHFTFPKTEYFELGWIRDRGGNVALVRHRGRGAGLQSGECVHGQYQEGASPAPGQGRSHRRSGPRSGRPTCRGR